MAVSSERLVSMAIGEKVDGEDLGGWRMHTDTTGLVDLAVDTDEEALDAIKTFLSICLKIRANCRRRSRCLPGSDDIARTVLDVLPEKRTQVYDVRRIIKRIADKDSMFELKSRFGKDGDDRLGAAGWENRRVYREQSDVQGWRVGRGRMR